MELPLDGSKARQIVSNPVIATLPVLHGYLKIILT